jgi:DNA topoisomerase VI subunit B
MGKKSSETLQQKSPAEFFAENKNIAGFDNVRERKAFFLPYISRPKYPA